MFVHIGLWHGKEVRPRYIASLVVTQSMRVALDSILGLVRCLPDFVESSCADYTG